MLGLPALGLMLLNLQQAVLPLLLHQHLPYAHTSAHTSGSMSTQYVPSTIIISVIIPTYNFQDTKLLRAIKSVNNQVAVPPMAKSLPPSEIIVVNDGSSESHFRDFADECKRRFPVSNTTGYDCKAGAHFILFVSNPVNEGLGGARNFGIQYASGKWILPLDADDELHPHFFGECMTALRKQNSHLNLDNPGRINVIMPYMMDFKSRPFGWQPSQNTTTIEESNVLHCCGLYLKSIWDSGIQYDKMMIYGWEDWDFWIKLQSQIGINAIIVEKPLYKYNIGEEKSGSGSHLSTFCFKNREICIAHLHLNNPCIYDKLDVVRSFEITRKFISSQESIPKWELVQQEAIEGDKFAQLLVHTKSSNSSSLRAFNSYYDNYCVDEHHICDPAVNRLEELAKIQEQLSDMIIFHIMVTKYSSDELWKKMLTHVVVGILDYNENSTLFVHSNLKLDEIFDKKFFSHFSNRIIISPIACHTIIAEKYGMSNVGKFINRYGNGRPFYYSHFTDYLRVLLLYSFGGVYLDTDVLLRQSVRHLHNAAAREDENFVNGAILSFDRFSPIMRYCLEQIPLVYNAFGWISIGPALITKASKVENFTTIRGDEVKFNVLDRRSFYDIHWNNVVGLTEVRISSSEYDDRKEFNLGYHFWGKFFYGEEGRVIADTSLLGFALQNTCRPDIMDCVVLTSK